MDQLSPVIFFTDQIRVISVYKKRKISRDSFFNKYPSDRFSIFVSRIAFKIIDRYMLESSHSTIYSFPVNLFTKVRFYAHLTSLKQMRIGNKYVHPNIRLIPKLNPPPFLILYRKNNDRIVR